MREISGFDMLAHQGYIYMYIKYFNQNLLQ